MKSILVPVDFSPRSNQAFEVAVQLAKKNNASICLLHCIEVNKGYFTSGGSDFPEMIFFVRQAEKTMLDMVKPVMDAGIEVKYVIKQVGIVESIKELIEKEVPDFIVMGSTGATGSKEVFLGSNAEKVVRNAAVPVLIIKEKTNLEHINKIVFACDFSQKYEKALHKAVSFAKFVGATIDFVYVNTPYQFRTTREINELITEFGLHNPEVNLRNVHTYNDFRIEAGIANFADDNDSDLICVFPATRSPLASFFNGSISEDLVNHSDRPVLSIKL